MRAVALLVIITVAFYWKLTFSRDFTFLNAPDLAYQVLPWYQFQARAWHSGTFPLWDPYEWCGQPLIGQLQPGATFPLNWPLFLAPLERVVEALSPRARPCRRSRLGRAPAAAVAWDRAIRPISVDDACVPGGPPARALDSGAVARWDPAGS